MGNYVHAINMRENSAKKFKYFDLVGDVDRNKKDTASDEKSSDKETIEFLQDTDRTKLLMGKLSNQLDMLDSLHAENASLHPITPTISSQANISTNQVELDNKIKKTSDETNQLSMLLGKKLKTSTQDFTDYANSSCSSSLGKNDPTNVRMRYGITMSLNNLFANQLECYESILRKYREAYSQDIKNQYALIKGKTDPIQQDLNSIIDDLKEEEILQNDQQANNAIQIIKKRKKNIEDLEANLSLANDTFLQNQFLLASKSEDFDHIEHYIEVFEPIVQSSSASISSSTSPPPHSTPPPAPQLRPLSVPRQNETTEPPPYYTPPPPPPQIDLRKLLGKNTAHEVTILSEPVEELFQNEDATMEPVASLSMSPLKKGLIISLGIAFVCVLIILIGFLIYDSMTSKSAG